MDLAWLVLPLVAAAALVVALRASMPHQTSMRWLFAGILVGFGFLTGLSFGILVLPVGSAAAVWAGLSRDAAGHRGAPRDLAWGAFGLVAVGVALVWGNVAAAALDPCMQVVWHASPATSGSSVVASGGACSRAGTIDVGPPEAALGAAFPLVVFAVAAARHRIALLAMGALLLALGTWMWTAFLGGALLGGPVLLAGLVLLCAAARKVRVQDGEPLSRST